MVVNIVLGDKEFRRLVEGNCVMVTDPSQPTINIVLEDIGFGVMRNHIDNAERGKSYAQESTTDSSTPPKTNPQSRSDG